MLKAEGLTLIKVLAIVLALWTASVSIAEEIEGRTAPDGPLQADRPAAVDPGQVPGHRRARW